MFTPHPEYQRLEDNGLLLVMLPTAMRSEVHVRWKPRDYQWEVMGPERSPYEWQRLPFVIEGYNFAELVKAVAELRAKRLVDHTNRKYKMDREGLANATYETDETTGVTKRTDGGRTFDVTRWAIKTLIKPIGKELAPFWRQWAQESESLAYDEVQYEKWMFAEFGRVPDRAMPALKKRPELARLAKDRYVRVAIAERGDKWETFYGDSWQKRSFRKSLMWMPRIGIAYAKEVVNFFNWFDPVAPLGRSRYHWLYLAALGSKIRTNYDYDAEETYLNMDREDIEPFYMALVRTPDAQLDKLMHRVAHEVYGQKPVRKLMQYAQIFMSWFDAPAARLGKNATVQRVYESQRDWHFEEERQRQQRQIEYSGYTLESKLAVPTVELPQDPRLEFIGTAARLIEEGNLMHHCVGQYCSSAVSGQAFHWHFKDDKDGEATIQVDGYGHIVQCYGPYNVGNTAAEICRKLLSAWVRRLDLNGTPLPFERGDAPNFPEGHPLHALHAEPRPRFFANVEWRIEEEEAVAPPEGPF